MFASGACNLLIATAVAEEGMDVQAANCIIRFNPMLNSVSFVQAGHGFIYARIFEQALFKGLGTNGSDPYPSALAASSREPLPYQYLLSLCP